MSPQAINKFKKKYNLTDADFTSVVVQSIVDNKMYSWKMGAGHDSNAKQSSIGVIAGRWFNAQNIISALDELTECHNATPFNADKLADQKKQKPESFVNNKIDIELSPNMSNAELVEYFTSRINSVSDPNKKFEYELKLLDKLDIKANTAVEDGNKPLVYLPQRCDSCQYCKADNAK